MNTQLRNENLTDLDFITKKKSWIIQKRKNLIHMLFKTDYTSFMIKIIEQYIAIIIKTYFNVFQFQSSNKITL